ncbi:ABC transporter substrate-binding protein [Corynebacterium otitidis]
MTFFRPAAGAAAAVLACAAALAGCSAGSTAAPVATGSERGVTVALTTGPASLDFTTTTGTAVSDAMIGTVYETLVSVDPDGEIEPLLATDWEVSPDGLTYTFNLREGVEFSTGEPFDAHSAKFSLDRVSSPAWTNGLKARLDPVDEVVAVDDYTLELRLDRPSNGLLRDLAGVVGAMMTPGGVDELATAPVGTGPYEAGRFLPGQSLELRARGDYWGDPPANEAVVLRYFPEATSAVNALAAGDVDAVWRLPAPSLLEGLPRDGGWQVDVGTSEGEFLLGMNNKKAPFDDLAVRRAVLTAVDHEAIRETVYEGLGVLTGGTPVPPTDPWFDPTPRYPFDPARARAILSEAGYATDGSDPRLKVTITVPARPYTMNASELLYSQLTDVGFDLDLELVEFPLWIDDVIGRHDFEMTLVAHEEPRDIPQLFGDPDYYLGVDSPAIRGQLARAQAAPPEDAADEMARAVDILMAEARADTMLNVPTIVASRPELSGVEPTDIAEGLPLASLSLEEGKQ